MKVLVCGGRDFSDWLWLKAELDHLHSIHQFSELIHGGAPGADTLANNWAATSGVPMRQFLALWRTYGRAAGNIRNQRMLDEGKPDLVVAFPGGVGTEDMISRAERADVKVIRVSR